MNKKTALTAAICGAVISAGAIVWAMLPEKTNIQTSYDSQTTETSLTSQSSLTDTGTHKKEKTDEVITQEAETEENSKVTVDSDGNRHFVVNVILAPYGYQVESDYILEIAKAEDVKSQPTSHLDSSDGIFYSAAVINGVTEIDLKDGKYAVCIYPEGEPDNFKRYTWDIDENTTNSDLKLIVTEKVEEGQVMIVLRWGDTPKDIDGYLVGEGDFVYYWGKEGEHARLDTDCRTGNGIETITITDTSGDFTYYVDNYSGEAPMGENSGATVTIFTSDTKAPQTFEIPKSIVDVWEVFSIKDGVITEIGKEGEPICPEG